jgi:putative SOS response-associated peptidase YedK
MCFFVEINLPRQELQKRFKLPVLNDPRYMPAYFHSAFTQPFLPVITTQQPNIIQFFQWGLIPFWTKNDIDASKIRNLTYNARAESVWTKPSFKAAARYRRCIVMIHGFFEYQTTNKQKIPYYIHLKDNEAFSLAGVYEDWTNQVTGEIHNTISILTTEANPLMAKIHNIKKRMPVILPEKIKNEWINSENDSNQLKELLIPFDDKLMEAYPVSRKISERNVDIMDPELIKPYFYSDSHGSLF